MSYGSATVMLPTFLDTKRYTMWVTKTTKLVTSITILSPIYFVANNCHQHHALQQWIIIYFSIEFRIKHEPTEEPTGPFEGRLDPISLLLVTGLNLKYDHKNELPSKIVSLRVADWAPFFGLAIIHKKGIKMRPRVTIKWSITFILSHF